MAVRCTKINYIRGVSGSGAEGSQVLWAINGGEDSFVDPYVMVSGSRAMKRPEKPNRNEPTKISLEEM